MRWVPRTRMSRTMEPVAAGGACGAGGAGCGVCAGAEDPATSPTGIATRAARLYRAKRWALRLIRSSQGLRARRANWFRIDSAGPDRSRWPRRTTPAQPPTPAETRRPGPAHRAAGPELLRMHSTEDAPRRGWESEKD